MYTSNYTIIEIEKKFEIYIIQLLDGTACPQRIVQYWPEIGFRTSSAV